jgi:hypothetical protein
LRSRARQQHGFQLAELLMSILIFSLVLGVCMYAASAGFRMFAEGSSRQVLQRDARAIFTWLRRDVGLSNLIRCQRVKRLKDGIGPDRRDVLGVAAMDSWQQPLAVDELGLPAWNRLVVYMATPNQNGLLLRQSYQPSGAYSAPLDANEVSAMVGGIANGPVGAFNVKDQRRLSGSVRSFAVELSESRNTAVFDLILTEATVEGGSGRARDEVLQIQTTIFPHNTWPRL